MAEFVYPSNINTNTRTYETKHREKHISKQKHFDEAGEQHDALYKWSKNEKKNQKRIKTGFQIMGALIRSRFVENRFCSPPHK